MKHTCVLRAFPGDDVRALDPVPLPQGHVGPRDGQRWLAELPLQAEPMCPGGQEGGASLPNSATPLSPGRARRGGGVSP